MALATPQHLRELAERYEPLMVFSTGQRVFPAQVESYLSHVSAAAWPPPVGEPPVRDLGAPPEAPGQAQFRGTAIMDGPPPGRRLGGPTAAGAPLRLDGADADGIGDSAYRQGLATGDLFLSFGGWSDNTLTSGDRGYLLAAFGELSAAMDPAIAWAEFESLPNRPMLWVEQPTAPTVYAETTWCADYLPIDERPDSNGQPARNFIPGGPDPASLRRLLAITYYVFFPLQDSPNGSPLTPSSRAREGQWEAATVYLEAKPSTSDDRHDLDITEPPLAVALSRDRTVQTPFASCRDWSSVSRQGAHPRLYVSRGRQMLLFAPPPDQVGNYAGPGGGASLNTRLDATDPGQDDFPGSEVLLVVAIVLGSPLLLILWLLSVLFGMHNEGHSGEAGPQVDTSTPQGDGQGSIATPTDAGGPGQVLPNGQRIDDPATTLLRFIDDLDRDPPQTIWPDDDDPGAPPPTIEHPYWWDFAGRWGVSVAGGATTWGPGIHRIDRSGRSLGYWNTVRLTQAWALGRLDRPA